MKLKQRKICGNCRVYSRVRKCCTIGYETKYPFYIGKTAEPLEPCPKPITVTDSIEAMRYWKKN